MRTIRRTALGTTAALAASALVLSACSGSGAADGGAEVDTGGAPGEGFPVTVEHAFGETTVEAQPERVATIAWGNHEAALALGVVPVIMEAAVWGDDDGDGVLPWVEEKVEEMGAEMPETFDPTDGIDFEAVAASEPDVILAGYSGLTQEEYDTLSQIAPVIAYPETPWGSTWQETLAQDAKGLGLEARGEEVVAELEGVLADKVAEHENLAGTSAMWAYVEPTDTSTFSYFTVNDPRVQLFPELGMEIPEAVTRASEGNEQFNGSESTETAAETFADADVMVVSTDSDQQKIMQEDPLMSKIPAVERDSIAWLPADAPEAAVSNPSPLNIGSEYMDGYLATLDAAAAKAKQD
ncbi:iron-siderophore ABC transporter substrate-binding protein [Brevibacterium album]|uniref:iron-siderophore ABC transporter substrate-binding protein n=1 Tax=Brevibacterium album TaxID=417948 RepID=UPI0003FD4352|nr:iron-siderophore ABC transporter substrate-binding protein [Brevibacterium album]